MKFEKRKGMQIKTIKKRVKNPVSYARHNFTDKYFLHNKS